MNEFKAEWTNEDALSVGWKSPIDTYTEEVQTAFDGEVLKAVQRVGINVDRDELLKALAYDREQYEKGFADGRAFRDAEIVRCKDCKHRDDDGMCCGRGWPIQLVPGDGFCDKGERRDDV